VPSSRGKALAALPRLPLQIVVLFCRLALLGAAVGCAFGVVTSAWLARIVREPTHAVSRRCAARPRPQQAAAAIIAIANGARRSPKPQTLTAVAAPLPTHPTPPPKIVLTFASAYSCYYVTEELLGASGLLAVVCNGFTASLIGGLLGAGLGVCGWESKRPPRRPPVPACGGPGPTRFLPPPLPAAPAPAGGRQVTSRIATQMHAFWSALEWVRPRGCGPHQPPMCLPS
jgi:hypothetical protein